MCVLAGAGMTGFLGLLGQFLWSSCYSRRIQVFAQADVILAPFVWLQLADAAEHPAVSYLVSICPTKLIAFFQQLHHMQYRHRELTACLYL